MAWGSIKKTDRVTAQRNIRCPFYKRWEGDRIVCECLTDPRNHKAETVTRFATPRDAQRYIWKHCYKIASGEVCPVAAALNLYYRGEDVCGLINNNKKK